MAVPTGYSGQSAIAMVRANTDELTQPADSQVLAFLNAGIEQVEVVLRAILQTLAYPTVTGQTTIQLDADIQEIEECYFSTAASGPNGAMGSAAPWAQGALVYPMQQLPPAAFFDAAAGFPAVGFGPPQAYMLYRDQGLAPEHKLSPPGPPQLLLVAGTSDAVGLSVVQTYLNPNGETNASPVAMITPNTQQSAVALSPGAQSNATGYNVYVSEKGGPYWKNNVTAVPLTQPWTIQTGGKWDVNSWDQFEWAPATTTQPPAENTATGSGSGGAIWMQVYPAAMLGQVNVRAKMRPQLWADTTASSWTDLDTMAQEACILWATIRVLLNRSRGDEAMQLWKPQLDAKMEELSLAIARRTNPRSGQVRDVANRAFPSAPFWMVAP